jgi:MFS transporter, ACS family, glucarate transporter
MTSPSASPTRVRYSILGLLCIMAMITYLDRAMNSRAQNEIMAAVGRPVVDFFWVLTAFQVAYAMFEVPTGYLGDRFGPRKTILRLVLLWSFFVGFNPVIGLVFPHEIQVLGTTIFLAYLVLIFAEFMFGVGEAGAFPNITRALYNWFPLAQRGFAQGSIWLSARFMGGLTPLVWVLLVELGGMSWRQALWLFAGAAAVWCIVFYFWFRNHPHEHPATNQAERDLIEAGRGAHAGHHGVPWGTIFTNKNVLALCAMYMVTNFNWYFIMYNLPLMLKARYTDPNPSAGLTMLLALLGGAPMLVGMAGCLIGGLLTDRYVRRTGDRKWGRRIFAMIGYGMAGLFYLAATGFLGPGAVFEDNLWLFAVCVMMVGFFNDWIMGPAWAACQDVGRRYSAIVSGTMNMVGNLGAVLGIQVTGRILRAYTPAGSSAPDTAGYVVLFTVYAAVYALGVGLWLLIDASKPLPREDELDPERVDYREPDNPA